MNISVNGNGIVVQKLFKSVTAAYSEIKSVVNKDWYVKKNEDGNPRLHIVSDDKKIYLEKSLFDSEVSVGPDYVVKQLDE